MQPRQDHRHRSLGNRGVRVRVLRRGEQGVRPAAVPTESAAREKWCGLATLSASASASGLKKRVGRHETIYVKSPVRLPPLERKRAATEKHCRYSTTSNLFAPAHKQPCR